MQVDPSMYLKPKEESFAQFIWNSERREFLGRTGTSWAKIGFFYLIFYSCLAAFFAAMLAVLYQTLDTEQTPTYTPGDGGSILQHPALGFRPRPPKDNIESTLIWYRSDDQNDYGHWVNELDKFITPYQNQTEDETKKECSFSTYKDDQDKKRAGEKVDKRVCIFSEKLILGKNGEGTCSAAHKWGYAGESPCVLLKLNKMINWEPDVYKNTDELPKAMPQRLKNIIMNETKTYGYTPPMVWVSCEGENPADQEYLTDIKFTPYAGFPAYYFPYEKNPAYRSPLVGVNFIQPQSNVLINIECRLWAKNIEHVKQDRLGVAHFELLRD